MRRSSSSSSSPDSARKRRRLSSPTYEEMFPITQEEVRVFDEVEKQLSQVMSAAASQSRVPNSRRSSSGKERRVAAEEEGECGGGGALVREKAHDWSSSPPAHLQTTQERVADDDFFSTVSGHGAGFVAATSVSPQSPAAPSRYSGFTSAAALPTESRAPLPRPRFSGGFASAATLKDTTGHGEADRPPEPVAPPGLAKFGGFGFASGLSVRPGDPTEDDHPSSPLGPPPLRDDDYDSWFDSDVSALPPDASITFKSARTIVASANADDASMAQAPLLLAQFSSALAHTSRSEESRSVLDVPHDENGENPLSVGFESAARVGFSSAAALNSNKKDWAAPSAEALARVAQMMKTWEAEDAAAEEETVAPSEPGHDIENAPPVAGPSSSASTVPTHTSFQTPVRPVLRPMENSEFSPAQIPDTPLASKSKNKNAVHYTTVGGLQIKNKQFKSPLISRQNRPNSTARPGSSLNPDKKNGGLAFASAAAPPKLPPAFPLEVGATHASTGLDSAAVDTLHSVRSIIPVSSPQKGRALDVTPRRVGGARTAGRSKFTTPFKPGMAPGESGRALLGGDGQRTTAQASTRTPPRRTVYATPVSQGKEKAKREYRFFDLNPRPERTTLASSGSRPQMYTEEELCDMGINVEELRQMRPLNAIYYTFYSPVPTSELLEDAPESYQLGPEAALSQLQELGCTLATQEWVTNHYGLILWKLAGMVCLEPEREQEIRTKRWCWPEVIRQLRYRYERELNGGSRPALRLISTEDAPAACPMVLCVSDITWTPAVLGKGGIPSDPHPELEVTDGWYRLRAKVDPPLARAVRRGFIGIGTKIAVSGARLSGDRKEACEILEAYDNTVIELSGNGTHLARWHAKLGFVKEPFIATMDSLTGDGGTVPAMDLIVLKAYPVGYSEFVRNDDGTTTKIGPRDEKEELKAHDQWLVRRDKAVVKIRLDLEKKIELMEKTADRLRNLAGTRFNEQSKRDEIMPDHIEDLYTEMMEDCPRPSQLFGRLSHEDAGWLRMYTMDQINLAKERLNEDIEREIQHVCPPRSVRDFRVILAKDARWQKHEPMRAAQITLWDPLRMVFSEGGTPGDIREGQRFLVTNLQPNQPAAWMGREPESMIYLISKKNTRWTNLRSKC